MEREIKRNNQGIILSYSLSDSNDTYGVIELNNFVRKFENLSFLQIIPTNVEEVSQNVVLGSNINEPIILVNVDDVGGGTIGGTSSFGGDGSSNQSSGPQVGITQRPPNVQQDGSSDEFSGQLYAPFGFPGQAPGDFAFDSTGVKWKWDGQQWNNF
jgi:hypothetical protein